MTQLFQKPTRIAKSSQSILAVAFVSSTIPSRNHAYDVINVVSNHKAVILDFFPGPIGWHFRRSSRTAFDFEKTYDESMLDELYYSLPQLENMILSPLNNMKECWFFSKF